MSEELKPFTEWFDRNVETGVRYSDNVIASLGPWSERREKFVRTIMEAAFYAGMNTRTPFEQAVREAVEAERASWEPVADALWQLLDDMGIDGLSVCPAAKKEAVTSYMGKVHGLFPDLDVLPAAIRAPQETNE